MRIRKVDADRPKSMSERLRELRAVAYEIGDIEPRKCELCGRKSEGANLCAECEAYVKAQDGQELLPLEASH
jgi:hypothetical protein